MFKNAAVCSKVPAPLTTSLLSSGILPRNKTFSTGLFLPDSNLTYVVQTCLFILSTILGWIILLEFDLPCVGSSLSKEALLPKL